MRRMLDPKTLGEGGGGKTYFHSISILRSEYHIYINIYSNSNKQLTILTLNELLSHCGNVICTGYYKTSTEYGIPNYVAFDPSYNFIKLYYFDPQSKYIKSEGLNKNIIINDSVS